MSLTTECQLLISQFNKLSSQVEKLAKAPQRMMETLNGMIRHAAESALQTTDAMFDALAEQLGLTLIEDTLESLEAGLLALQNCSQSIGSNPLIQGAVGADLASLTGAVTAADAAGQLREMAQAQARENALAALDKGMSALGLGSQLGKTTMRYQQMLKSAGILDSIDLMNDIVTCLSSLCSNASSYQAKVDTHLSNMKLNSDQSVQNLWADQSTAAQAAISDTAARGAALESRITNWTGGTF